MGGWQGTEGKMAILGHETTHSHPKTGQASIWAPDSLYILPLWFRKADHLSVACFENEI